MLNSVKNKDQRKALIDLLTWIVNGTVGPTGFAFVPKAEAEKLVKAEPTFVTLDSSVVNAEGQIKAVASTIAIEALKTPSAPPAPATPASAPEAMKFERIKLQGLPAIQRGGGIKSDSYPFADLLAPVGEEYDAFFVAATEAQPNPAKRLVSTVSSANKKYGKLIPPRAFTVRKHLVDGKVAGANVIRTA